LTLIVVFEIMCTYPQPKFLWLLI